MAVALLERSIEIPTSFSDRKKQRTACQREVQRMRYVAVGGICLSRNDYMQHVQRLTQVNFLAIYAHAELGGLESVDVLETADWPNGKTVEPNSRSHVLSIIESVSIGGVNLFLMKHRFEGPEGPRVIYNGGFGCFSGFDRANPHAEASALMTFLPERSPYPGVDELHAHIYDGAHIVGSIAAGIGMRYTKADLAYTHLMRSDPRIRDYELAVS